MRCPCPKCEVTIEVDHQGLSAGGNSMSCPECSDKYWILKEGFHNRALKKHGKLFCSDCGHEMGYDPICLKCGSRCPEYCVVQDIKPVAKAKRSSGFQLGLSRKDKTSNKESKNKKQALSPPQEEAGSVEPAKERSAKGGIRILAYALIAVLVVALSAGIGKAFMNYQANKQYSKTFIVALYGVKSGTDMSMKQIDDLTARWQDEEGIKTNIAPQLDAKAKDKMGKVMERVNAALGELGETPEKFMPAKSNLLRLHGIYEKIYALNISSPDSLENFVATRARLDKEFFKAAKELKSSMPEILKEELVISVNKYKNLEFMVKN